MHFERREDWGAKVFLKDANEMQYGNHNDFGTQCINSLDISVYIAEVLTIPFFDSLVSPQT